MNTNEKLLLIELILRDIRGNWGWDNRERRDCFARDLCKAMTDELEEIKILAQRIEMYIDSDEKDGRFFRTEFPRGYDGMEKLHGLKPTIKDKSDEFKDLAIMYITYPDSIFDDIEGEDEWHEFEDSFYYSEVRNEDQD